MDLSSEDPSNTVALYPEVHECRLNCLAFTENRMAARHTLRAKYHKEPGNLDWLQQ